MSLMYPNPQLSYKQQGSMLVIALFIIVVMSLLVGSMSKLLQSSSETISLEVLGTRAFFAAQTGMESAVALIYPLDIQDVNDSVAACTSPIFATTFSQAQGLLNCNVTVSCSSRESTIEAGVYHFWLSSTGSCGGGETTTLRTIEMEVWQ